MVKCITSKGKQMTEHKTQIIAYYPRSRFWKFWEKRKILAVLTKTNKRVTSKSFYPDGTLKRNYIRWKNGNTVEQIYFPNGTYNKVNEIIGDQIREILWNENGKMILHKRLNQKTQIETQYHPNGQLKMRHDRKTGSYEEWAENGVLKKKGRWLNRTGGIAELSNPFAGFETGNMRIKQQDELRQEYNEVIDAINNLPATAGRKIAKHALAREYRKSIQKTRN
jgi:antitoxin component YwqK of YwqJK toxin-antitoxin module